MNTSMVFILFVFSINSHALKTTNATTKLIVCAKHGTAPGQFFIEEGTASMPYAITGFAINSLGHIIVADANKHRIQVFNQQGEVILVFGTKYGDSSLDGIRDVIVDKEDNIYVSANNQIKVFNNNGEFIHKIDNINGNHLGEMPLLFFYSPDVITAQQEYLNSLAYNFSITNYEFLGEYKYNWDPKFSEYLSLNKVYESIGFINSHDYIAVFCKPNYELIPISEGRIFIGRISQDTTGYKFKYKIDLIYDDNDGFLDELFEKNYELDREGNIYNACGNLENIFIYKIIPDSR